MGESNGLVSLPTSSETNHGAVPYFMQMQTSDWVTLWASIIGSVIGAAGGFAGAYLVMVRTVKHQREWDAQKMDQDRAYDRQKVRLDIWRDQQHRRVELLAQMVGSSDRLTLAFKTVVSRAATMRSFQERGELPEKLVWDYSEAKGRLATIIAELWPLVDQYPLPPLESRDEVPPIREIYGQLAPTLEAASHNMLLPDVGRAEGDRLVSVLRTFTSLLEQLRIDEQVKLLADAPDDDGELFRWDPHLNPSKLFMSYFNNRHTDQDDQASTPQDSTDKR